MNKGERDLLSVKKKAKKLMEDKFEQRQIEKEIINNEIKAMSIKRTMELKQEFLNDNVKKKRIFLEDQKKEQKEIKLMDNELDKLINILTKLHNKKYKIEDYREEAINGIEDLGFRINETDDNIELINYEDEIVFKYPDIQPPKKIISDELYYLRIKSKILEIMYQEKEKNEKMINCNDDSDNDNDEERTKNEMNRFYKYCKYNDIRNKVINTVNKKQTLASLIEQLKNCGFSITEIETDNGTDFEICKDDNILYGES